MSGVDGRGSNNQRKLYSMLKELYPGMDIIYEYKLPNNQRVDLFIPILGIAVEYDGEQHFNFIDAWHKDLNGFISQKKMDSNKDKILYDIGIKLVRIPYDEMVNNPEELKSLIDKTPYPNVEYIPMQEEKELNSYLESVKIKNREFNKQRYKAYKERQKVNKRSSK